MNNIIKPKEQKGFYIFSKEYWCYDIDSIESSMKVDNYGHILYNVIVTIEDGSTDTLFSTCSLDIAKAICEYKGSTIKDLYDNLYLGDIHEIIRTFKYIESASTLSKNDADEFDEFEYYNISNIFIDHICTLFENFTFTTHEDIDFTFEKALKYLCILLEYNGYDSYIKYSNVNNIEEIHFYRYDYKSANTGIIIIPIGERFEY